MARLNEPNVAVESHLEILRRKFLRQNRDIAKINSEQSQKIRRLENDLARLLSENLELRGHILRLEKQVEDNAARRIADHALEVKAKLEAQLSEFSALLGSLGEEPPSKRRSSDVRTLAKRPQSTIRSPLARRRRDTADTEALAEQEGRLPPIFENKTYPRATMSGDEILALCAAAADTSDSPDLGPPPVSRYIEEHPTPDESPATVAEADVMECSVAAGTPSPPPKLDYDRKPSASPEPKDEVGEAGRQDRTSADEAAAAPPAPTSTVQPIRAGAKRKYGDENGTVGSAATGTGKENMVAEAQKVFPTRGAQKRRSIKDLPASKRERAGGARIPLAAKSTNEDVSSPRKTTKAAPLKEGLKAPAPSTKPVLKIELPPPVPTEPPAVDAVLLESVSALPSAAPSSPSTPDRPPRADIPHDTPPPADISSTGETSRPSRRARVAISYAEPNLRDKMRRPTKELFDAVTGEGKFVHRVTASSRSDDHHPSAPTSSSRARPEPGSSTGRSSSRAVSAGDPTSKGRQQAVVSPLAQKDVFAETLPSTVVTERRKRPSAVGSARESVAAVEKLDGADLGPALPPTAQIQAATQQNGGNKPRAAPSTAARTGSNERRQHPPKHSATLDIYDFAGSSPPAPTPPHRQETLPPSESAAAAASSVVAQPATASGRLANNADHHNTNTSSSSSKTLQPPSRSTRPTRKSSVAAAAALRELLNDDEQQQQQQQDEAEFSSSITTAATPTTSSSSSTTASAKALAKQPRSSQHPRKRASASASMSASMSTSISMAAAAVPPPRKGSSSLSAMLLEAQGEGMSVHPGGEGDIMEGGGSLNCSVDMDVDADADADADTSGSVVDAEERSGRGARRERISRRRSMML